MTRIAIIIAAGLAFVAATTAGPVQAQNTRSFVSGLGSDSNSCTLAAPCRSFQHAHDQTNAGGEIAVLDTAGYGAVTITKSISIVNPGGVEAGILVPSGGTAITINAGASDAIQLRGLTIEGSGVGYNGIVFNSGGSLTVTNCVVQNFFSDGSHFTIGNGILMQPTSGTISFVITNTIVSNNGLAGINYLPTSGSATANGVIDHVVATNNHWGIALEPAGSGSTKVAISNSIASNNGNIGIYIANGSGSLGVSIDNISASDNNGGTGIIAGGTSNVILGRSVITGNNLYGILNSSSTFYSYLDNRINGNGASSSNDVAGTALLSYALK